MNLIDITTIHHSTHGEQLRCNNIIIQVKSNEYNDNNNIIVCCKENEYQVVNNNDDNLYEKLHLECEESIRE